VKTLTPRRASLPLDVVDRERAAARRSTRTTVDLAADVRTLTTDTQTAIEQRDQALTALAATLAAVRTGESPEFYALPVLTRYAMVPAPGTRPHHILGRRPHPDDTPAGGLRRPAQLPVDDLAPAYARRLVAAVAVDWYLPADLVDDARTVISELVTNAVIHASYARGGGILAVLALSPTRSTLTIEVHDPDPTLPVMPEAAPGPDAVLDADSPAGTHGAGLRIVDNLCAGLDAAHTERGKAVIAVLAMPHGGAR
jgi:anti-sigma regulatory factor (Ser/Thr protein kinase)